MKVASQMMFLVVFMLLGCSPAIENGDLIYQQQVGTGDEKIAAVAYNDKEIEEIWSSNGIEDKHPNVDFEKYAVVFLHTIENSCPKEISKFELSEDGKQLIIETTQSESTCNDIGIPKTFVLQMEKGLLKSVETISFEGRSFSLD